MAFLENIIAYFKSFKGDIKYIGTKKVENILHRIIKEKEKVQRKAFYIKHELSGQNKSHFISNHNKYEWAKLKHEKHRLSDWNKDNLSFVILNEHATM